MVYNSYTARLSSNFTLPRDVSDNHGSDNVISLHSTGGVAFDLLPSPPCRKRRLRREKHTLQNEATAHTRTQRGGTHRETLGGPFGNR